MAWLAVNQNGSEHIFPGKPQREGGEWCYMEPVEVESEHGELPFEIELPKGTIKFLTGRDLTWKDAPFHIPEKGGELPYIELLFQYKGIWYCERIYLHNIDSNHYEEIWDYWFGNSAEDDEPELVFEVTANKTCGHFTLDDLYINVYENDDANTPIAVITEFAYRKSWIDCKGFR